MKRVTQLVLFLVVTLGLGAEEIGRSSWSFTGGSTTPRGPWSAVVRVSDGPWQPGTPVGVTVDVSVAPSWWDKTNATPPEALAVLVTAERCFSPDGHRHLPSDEKMSTLLTPGGLAIEGGAQGALSPHAGSAFRTPLDLFETLPVSPPVSPPDAGAELVSLGTVRLGGSVADNLPPGLYRLRIDLGFRNTKTFYNLGGSSNFARRTFSADVGTESTLYSPVFSVGPTATTAARLPWVLLADYDSNGYRGVVADEDRSWFALSDRNIIHDEVILPLVDPAGKPKSYSLEPAFLTEEIDPVGGLALAWPRGQISVQVTRPDGTVQDLGSFPFVGPKKNRQGPTTGKAALTGWRPSGYGLYTVKAVGWTEDAGGRHYEGGGTYRFWIAERLTLATATFQGMAWPLGSKYGRDLAFNPPLPARVTTDVTLYPGSTQGSRSLHYEGTATLGGVFGAAQGMVPFPLDEPGEYLAHIRATATDDGGRLWVCAYTHAGVVYAPDTTLVAHGKPVVRADKSHGARGSTLREGGPIAGEANHLEHLTFPWNSGDVLLVASEGGGSNKIEPVLTWSRSADPVDWKPGLDSVGTTNLSFKTSSGYSPHLYPEQITDREYYYGAAPRPGFMGRFLVAESVTRAPYWPTSNTNFGNQIGASKNGDQPGEIYRLLGGVVRHPQGSPAEYAGYLSNAIILPPGTNDNRVVAPGSEDVVGPDGRAARFFLVGYRPGMALPVGASFVPGVQIDPVLPVHVKFWLTFPDGHTETTEGNGDALGSFGAPQKWTLTAGGLYRYRLEGTWEGHVGKMPGLPDDGGFFFVYDQPRADLPRLTIDLPPVSKFPADKGLTIGGHTTANEVWCAVITPGAVLSVGKLPVNQGSFSWKFDPQEVDRQSPVYDAADRKTGAPSLGRVVHVSFLARELGSDGRTQWSFRRVVLRGDVAVATE